MKKHITCSAIALAAAAFCPPMGVLAQSDTVIAPTPSMAEDLVYLRDRMALQSKRLDETEEALARQQTLIDLQEQKIAELERQLGQTTQLAQSLQSENRSLVAAVESANESAAASLAAAAPAAPSRVAAAPAPKQKPRSDRSAAAKVDQSRPASEGQRPQQVAQNDAAARQGPQAPAGLPQEVGVRPEEEDQQPYLSVFSDKGGILTPRGALFGDVGVDYTTSTDSRFFFDGVEIVNAVLIGNIEATDTDRNAVSTRASARYGITSRLEASGNIAYVYRDDRIDGFDIDASTPSLQNLDGSGIGDVGFGLRYQLNDGKNLPYFIASLRAKAPTGTGPFDVDRTPEGAELELATGSGYWTVEPGLSFLYSSDPAVIFGNIGYSYNFSTSPNQMIGPNLLREFDPGDAIKASIGVGLSLNERMSINFGYDQSYFLRTRSIIDQFEQDEFDPTQLNFVGTVESESPTAVVGSFLFGGSYAVSDAVRLNLNTGFGATDNAPDMRVSLRASVKLLDGGKK